MTRSFRFPVTTFAGVLAIGFAASADAELHPRLGGAAAYDDALDITWVTDAGLSGAGSWEQQLDWVATLNSSAYLGFSDWRLASMSTAAGVPTGMTSEVVDCSTIWQPLCRDNELGYMFFHNLNGAVSQDLTGSRIIGDVTLNNIRPTYWSGTASGATNAWMYHFDIGFGVWSPKGGHRHGWLVRSGDVDGEDVDGDGIADAGDNCLHVPNIDQRDTDNDGFGNACDPDLNNDDAINFVDLALLKGAFFSSADNADFTGDGVVNFADLAVMKAMFFGPPGPSGQQ